LNTSARSGLRTNVPDSGVDQRAASPAREDGTVGIIGKFGTARLNRHEPPSIGLSKKNQENVRSHRVAVTTFRDGDFDGQGIQTREKEDQCEAAVVYGGFVGQGIERTSAEFPSLLGHSVT
jgi:hypothetical protein